MGRCEEREDGDGCAGWGVVGLIVEDDTRGGRRGCWWHFLSSEEVVGAEQR